MIKVYNPTVEELLDFFKTLVVGSIIRKSDLPEILKINLGKYGMADKYDYFRKEIEKDAE